MERAMQTRGQARQGSRGQLGTRHVGLPQADGGHVPQLLSIAAEGDKDAIAPALNWLLRRQSIAFDTLIRLRQAKELLVRAIPSPPG